MSAYVTYIWSWKNLKVLKDILKVLKDSRLGVALLHSCSEQARVRVEQAEQAEERAG